jgi:hypothetical protein
MGLIRIKPCHLKKQPAARREISHMDASSGPPVGSGARLEKESKIQVSLALGQLFSGSMKIY